jgi:PAS domain S-box-containing protein
VTIDTSHGSDEVRHLRERLDEAEATILAISQGEVDAFLVRSEPGAQVLLLGTAERPYRLLVDKMHQGAVTLDGKGVVLYANRHTCTLLGRSMEQIVGAPFASFVTEAQRAMLDAVIERAPSGGEGQIAIQSATNERIPVHVTATSLIGVPGAACLLLTDLRGGLADEALIASETLGRSILEQAVDAIVVCDRAGRVIRSSRSAHMLARANPLLQRFADAFPLRDADGEPIDLEGPLSGGVIRTREVRLDGTDVDLLLSAGPVNDEDGQVIGCVVTMTDIGARKQVERTLREDDRRKDEFLAMLAHELRNPLAPIRNAVRILDLVGAGEAPAGEARQVIHRQVANLVRLVDDLLDVSRITQGKIHLQPEPVDFASIVSWAVESTKPFYDERGHRLELRMPEGALPVHADVIRTTQAVVNLLINAAKFTPTPDTIRIEAERRACEGGEWVELRVHDPGIGIPAEMLPHIFDPFRQVRGGARRDEGLGLGLTLARRFMDMQGGTLDASSDGPGAGSTFVLRMPIVHAPAAPPDDHSADLRPEPSAAAMRVLVVDDNRDAAESLGTLLHLLGHEARASFDGGEAVAMARDYRPDVVLLDIAMPGMDGYEVARALRSEPELEGTLIVALTGFGSERERRMTREAGIDRHLVKPVEIEALQSILASAGTRTVRG